MTKQVFKKPWKKNLYENDEYPDNYTDKSFLDERKKNLYIRKVTFAEACLGAGLLSQQICVVIIFTCIFIYLYNEWLDPVDVIIYSGCLSVFIYCVLFFGNYKFLKTSRTLGCYIICIYLLSPVLKTLTETISTDTIYSTTVCMMIIHLIFFDYGVPALIVSSSLSLNAAIFGAVCLASRLPTSISVTAFLHITVQCFALAPLFLTKIGFSFYTLIALVTLTAIMLYSVSRVMVNFFLITVGFINLVCPYFFIKWYSYKDNIYGPWDEAMIRIPNQSVRQK